MSSFLKFLVMILTSFILIILGAGIATLALWAGWYWLFWVGLIIAAFGLIWGLVLLLWHTPVDLLP